MDESSNDNKLECVTITLTKEHLRAIESLAEIAPEIMKMVEERHNQEIFNKRAAEIGRRCVFWSGVIGAFIGSVYGMAKLMFTLGKGN